MSAVRPALAVTLLAVSTALFAAPTRPPAEEVIDGRRAAIVAFAPSTSQDSRDDGDIEGIAHTRFALEDTRRCLGARTIEYRLVFADRLRVVGVRPLLDYRGALLGQGFGAVLVRPGHAPELVAAKDGASTLQELLPHAAARLWQEPACESPP